MINKEKEFYEEVEKKAREVFELCVYHKIPVFMFFQMADDEFCEKTSFESRSHVLFKIFHALKKSRSGSKVNMAHFSACLKNWLDCLSEENLFDLDLKERLEKIRKGEAPIIRRKRR
jgi:hypothetical protein